MCRTHPPHFNHSWSAVQYNEPMRHLLHKYKYGKKTALRHYFSKLMIQFLTTYHLPLTPEFLLIPIPLHFRRQCQRGYNQSELLAKQIAKKAIFDTDTRTLQRCRHTANQAALSAKDRWTNIYSAFTIKSPEKIKNKKILLVDDLLTTGSTASEAAKTLKEAGAKEVSVLTLAMALDPDQEQFQ